MDDFDLRLRERLGAFEAAVPVSDRPIRRNHLRSRGVRTTAALAAALVLMALVGGVVGAGLVVYGTPRGYEGFENEGQPFHGTGLSCMTPPDAHSLMIEGGYTVSWQIEDRNENGIGTTTFSGSPPEHGVIDGGFVEGPVAYVLVSIGSGAHPHPNCSPHP